MRRPNKETIFLPLSEIGKYSDPEKYYCCGAVFSPDTENDHFEGCPPYIEISEVESFDHDNNIYFEVPQIVAYYAKTHPGYTMTGLQNKIEQGRRQIKQEIKKLLDI